MPLAPLRDSAVVLAKLAEALELREEGEIRIEDKLVQVLAGRRRLVLLDNAEHLLPDLADSVALLREIEGPTLLVTSRERLQLQGEQVYPVSPLAPGDGVRLFVARARALDPSFDGDGVISELCERLENLPLALELAAARTQLFSPRQLLDRLAQRLDLFRGGRDADPRQRTLRATITWSYDLLDQEEQRLFARLSVFAGGCTYEAAEKVGGATPDALQSLLDKSLLRRRDTEAGPRFWMLETIREYAEEQLGSRDGADGTQESHAEYFAALAERTDAEVVQGHITPDLMNRMRPELDNILDRARARERAADRQCCSFGSPWAWRRRARTRVGPPSRAPHSRTPSASHRPHPRTCEHVRSAHSRGRRSTRTISTSPRTPQAPRLNSYEDKTISSVSQWL